MPETIQTLIVLAVTICAIAYASWCMYKSLAAKDGGCNGCPLKDSCRKAKRKRGKKAPWLNR